MRKMMMMMIKMIMIMMSKQPIERKREMIKGKRNGRVVMIMMMMMMTMMTTKRKRKMIKGRISGKIVMMMMMMKDINHLMMNMKIREEADTNMRRRNITVKLIKKINTTKTSWDQQRSHEREKQ